MQTMVTNVADLTVNVTLPRALLADIGLSQQNASGELLRSFILSLYRRDHISTGKAAHLLGISRLAFLRLLAEEKIPYLDYTEEELEHEFEVASQWTHQLSSVMPHPS
jgi:predicted HTH domain antitoxin